jgi:steroid delta-isomerase-like uncharacterized protein
MMVISTRRRQLIAAKETKTTIKKFYEEVVNTREPNRADQHIATDMVEHGDLPGTEGYDGLEAFKQFLSTMINAFPDYQTTIEEVIAEMDKVVVLTTVSGTHHGDFMGLAPTGTHITLPGIDIYRVVEGNIVEHRGYFDGARLMQQLIGFPRPGQTAGGPTAVLRTG